MITNVLMAFLVLGIAFSILWKARFDNNKNSFMTVEDSKFLRGFWCIIVVLVHIPLAYQNRIQDMLGSFAYIGVTFFFMTSSYGLKCSIKNKPGYMNNFWRKRIPVILVPALIANAIRVLIGATKGEDISFLSFFNISNWVKVLLLFYFLFWLVYYVLSKFIKEGVWQDFMMCCLVCGCSLIDRLTNFKITSIWIVEPLGFAYGIILANHEDQIKKRINQRWGIKSIALLLLSVVAGIAYVKLKLIYFWGDYLLKIVLGVTMMSFIFTVLGRVRVGNSINSFLGYISYEIFLMHGTAFSLLSMIGIHNSGVFICSSILITILISFLLNKMCRKILRR